MSQNNTLKQEIDNMLMKNYFDMLAVCASFKLDKNLLKTRMLELQKLYHPDNHQQEKPDILDKIMLLSSKINHAYQVLSNSSSRAIYLLNLLKVPISDDNFIMKDSESLMQQMDIRQQIDHAFASYNTDALQDLEHKIKKEIEQLEDKINDYFQCKQYNQIEEKVQMMIFYQKAIDMIANH
jgi:molecular chaperone HscB